MHSDSAPVFNGYSNSKAVYTNKQRKWKTDRAGGSGLSSRFLLAATEMDVMYDCLGQSDLLQLPTLALWLPVARVCLDEWFPWRFFLPSHLCVSYDKVTGLLALKTKYLGIDNNWRFARYFCLNLNFIDNIDDIYPIKTFSQWSWPFLDHVNILVKKKSLFLPPSLPLSHIFLLTTTWICAET